MIRRPLAVTCLLAAQPLSAADRTWDGTIGSYSVAVNWDGDTLPATTDNVTVGNGGTIQIQATDAAWTVNDLRAGNVSGQSGAYLQLGSTVQLRSWFRLGTATGAAGRYTLQGGALRMHTNAGGHVHIGESGSGVLEITGGSVTVSNSNHIILGDRDTGDLGSATANGLVLHSGGTFTTANELWIGQGSAGAGNLAGSYNLSGTGQLSISNWVAIGRSGSTGAMNISGGTFSKTGAGNVILGHAGGSGTITQTGGTVTNTTNTWFGEGGGSGVWTLSGNAVANLGLIELAYSPTSKGTLKLDGGTLTTSLFDAVLPGTATINLNGGTLRPSTDQRFFLPETIDAVVVKAGGAIIDTNGRAITIGRGMTDGGGGGGLTKKGAGTLTLSGTHVFSGAADVAAGNLEISGMLANANSAAPAASASSGLIGTLATGSLSFASGSSLDAQIDSGKAIADLVKVSGNVELGGTTLNLTDLGSAALPEGSRLTLISYTGTLTGAFANAADGDLLVVGPNRFRLSLHDANAVTLMVPAAGVGESYATWAGANGLSGSNSATSADPDGDGLPNSAEFAVVSNPLSPAASGRIVTRMLAPSPGELPVLTLTLPVRSGATFSGSNALVSASVDGVVYRIEGSSDLQTFTAMSVAEIPEAPVDGLPPLPAGWTYRTFRAAGVPGSPDFHEFLRFTISDAPAAP